MFPRELHDRLLLVGGSVRDSLSGVPIKDIDLITTLPEKTLLLHRFRRVEGKTTAPIYFKGDPLYGKIEITRLQEDLGLEADLIRRDFRCNAVAVTLAGQMVDPLHGVADIEKRRMYPCASTSLKEDPIRIFRAFRFASDGWEISPELAEMIRSGNWEERLSEIPVERFSREMVKALAGKSPADFFACLLEYDVGRCYLPELFRMQEIPAGPAAYHGTNTLFSHSLTALRRMTGMTDDPVARLAALFHDLGKLSTPPELLPRHIGHDRAGAEVARELASRLRLSVVQRNAIVAASKLHMTGGRWDELRDVTKLKLAEQSIKSGIAGFFPQLVAADCATTPILAGWDEILLAVSSSAAELGIDTAALSSMNDRDRTSLITQRRLEKFRQLTAVKPA
ncbi:MAG: HD domain-containing protein [Geobacter sp.]|nr:HD domain-containing protein [Geobacter sp.]